MSSYFKHKWLRNQMEGALWHYMSALPNWGDIAEVKKVPKVFSSRIKKLLNIDRANGNEKSNWAFFDYESEGTGAQEKYSDYNVFLMGIGLHLLNIGFKQSEIIFFLQNAQHLIEPNYKTILKEYDEAPVFGSGRQRTEKDNTCFMMINRIEMIEAIEALSNHGSKPVILAPHFAFGTNEVKRSLEKWSKDYVAFITIELADLALRLPKIIENTEPAGRGRPKA
jgi:hypothetical protein